MNTHSDFAVVPIEALWAVVGGDGDGLPNCDALDLPVPGGAPDSWSSDPL
jgi:hypothetical protein